MTQINNFQTTKEMVIPIPRNILDSCKRKWLDVPYASLSPKHKLDIYLPEEGDGPFPVLLNIHGGGFAEGDKQSIQNMHNFINGINYGYAVVSVNYRLSDEAIFPAGLQDIKAAIRWLRINHNKYLLDTDRIAACGGSSGGNFAAMVCLTDKITKFDDPQLGDINIPCNVHAAVDWFGPIDFLTMDEQLNESGYGPGDHGQVNSYESRYLGAKLSDVPLKVALANPMTYIHKNMPPILIQHGRLDSLVPVQQSILFAEKLRKIVSPDKFEFDIIEGAGHGDPLFETKQNIERVFSFLDKHLK
jgi:acetyl esterase/lipase